MEGWQVKSRWADRVRSNHSESRMHTEPVSDRREKVIDKIKQVWEEKRVANTQSSSGRGMRRTEFPTGWQFGVVGHGLRVRAGGFNISWPVENYGLIACPFPPYTLNTNPVVNRELWKTCIFSMMSVVGFTASKYDLIVSREISLCPWLQGAL